MHQFNARAIGFVLAAVVLTTGLVAAENYAKATSRPRLRIKAVMTPRQVSRPLQIMLEFAAEGSTALAVSQHQFSIRLGSERQPNAFASDALFPTNTPATISVPADMALALDMTTSTNRLAKGGWNDLPPGTYTLRVCIDAVKAQQFDDQVLREVCSDEYPIVVK